MLVGGREDPFERRGVAERTAAAFAEVRAVFTTMPSCAVSVQPVWSFGIPSTSTRHMRHAPIAAPSRGS